MSKLSVWAPHARTVEIVLNGLNRPMGRSDNGWWSLESPEIAHGADYAYIVDGQQPALPDPRSPWQPQGVHKPSRVVDHGKFTWTDSGWQPPPFAAAVIYELHVGTFSPQGTFDGVIGKLDHISDLGVTHVELMPVNAFSGSRGWGYDGVSLFAPHEAYGGPEGLKRLVNACHRRGLAVVQDVVYNHLGPEGNYLGKFGPYFTERYRAPWGEAVNFDDAFSHEVRRFFCDNAVMWFRDYHVDALRIDAIHAIFDMTATHILEQLVEETAALSAQLGRHLTLIAESDLNDPRVIRPREIGGYGIDAQWSDDFHHALHTVLTDESSGYYQDFGAVADLAKALKSAYVYDGKFSAYRQRYHGRPIGELSGHRFLGFIQNHDQVGNRAQGDRLSQLVSPGKLKIAAALVLMAPFVPMLFQGEEWGATTPFQYFTNHQDRQLGEAVRKGRREEFAAFGWDPEQIPDPQAEETFERCRLCWQELDGEQHRSLLDWYTKLIYLRRAKQSLIDGRLDLVDVSYDEKAEWLVMRRGSVLVAVNFAKSDSRITAGLAASGAMLLSSNEAVRLGTDGLTLPGESVAILRIR